MQTCLNSPDPPPVPSNCDQRMSATGYEETELTYNVNEEVTFRENMKEGETQLRTAVVDHFLFLGINYGFKTIL